MLIFEILFALMLALVLSLSITAALGRRRPGDTLFSTNMVFLFVLIFLVAWAGGIWLKPLGPQYFGIYLLPFFVVAILVSLLVMALAPRGRPRTRKEAIEQNIRETEAEKAFSIFFWILVLALLSAIILFYIT